MHTVVYLKIVTHTQPFYVSLDFVWDNPGEPVPESTFCDLLDFLVQNEDNTGRHTNSPDARLIGAPTFAIPTIFTPDALPCTTLPWLGTCTKYAGLHMQWLEEMCEVEGARPSGRPKKTWREIVKKDCQACKLNKDRKMWRKQVRDDS